MDPRWLFSAQRPCDPVKARDRGDPPLQSPWSPSPGEPPDLHCYPWPPLIVLRQRHNGETVSHASLRPLRDLRTPESIGKSPSAPGTAECRVLTGRRAALSPLPAQVWPSRPPRPLPPSALHWLLREGPAPLLVEAWERAGPILGESPASGASRPGGRPVLRGAPCARQLPDRPRSPQPACARRTRPPHRPKAPLARPWSVVWVKAVRAGAVGAPPAAPAARPAGDVRGGGGG